MEIRTTGTELTADQMSKVAEIVVDQVVPKQAEMIHTLMQVISSGDNDDDLESSTCSEDQERSPSSGGEEQSCLTNKFAIIGNLDDLSASKNSRQDRVIHY